MLYIIAYMLCTLIYYVIDLTYSYIVSHRSYILIYYIIYVKILFHIRPILHLLSISMTFTWYTHDV